MSDYSSDVVLDLAAEGGGRTLCREPGPTGPMFYWKHQWEFSADEDNSTSWTTGSETRHPSIAQAAASINGHWVSLRPMYVNPAYADQIWRLFLETAEQIGFVAHPNYAKTIQRWASACGRIAPAQ